MEYNDYLRIMIKIGMPLSSVGTSYAIRFLQLINEREYKYFKDVYGQIAKENKTNAKNVEKCITTALGTCRDKPIDYNIVEKYLGYNHVGTKETLIRLNVQIMLCDKTA